MIYVLGGGVNLNYKVVGGTSQPTSPKENTIWVNTSTEITSHVFSATEPTNPVEGMVWLKTSTTSTAPFNALKKNALWVYPIACKQYINNAGVTKEAKTYQNGVWTEWTTYLFQSGKGEIVDLTIKKQSSASINIGTESIIWSYSANEVNLGALRNTEPIDITNYSKFVVDAEITAQKTALSLMASTKAFDQTGESLSAAAATKTTSANSTRTKWTLDISNLTGEHYVGLRGSAKATIYDVYLEP